MIQRGWSRDVSSGREDQQCFLFVPGIPQLNQCQIHGQGSTGLPASSQMVERLSQIVFRGDIVHNFLRLIAERVDEELIWTLECSSQGLQPTKSQVDPVGSHTSADINQDAE